MRSEKKPKLHVAKILTALHESAGRQLSFGWSNSTVSRKDLLVLHDIVRAFVNSFFDFSGHTLGPLL